VNDHESSNQQHGKGFLFAASARIGLSVVSVRDPMPKVNFGSIIEHAESG
jgi:hypothetical protein